MISNLKKFNKAINYKQCKIEPINDVISSIKPNAYLASINLKDAFFSMPKHINHQRYLMFYWKTFSNLNVCLTDTVLVPFSYLRKSSYTSVVYASDSYLWDISSE